MFSELIFKLLKYAKADQLPPPRLTRWLMVIAGVLAVFLTVGSTGLEFHAHGIAMALVFLVRDYVTFTLIFMMYVFLLLAIIYNPVRAVLSMAITVRDALAYRRNNQ